MKKQYKGLIYSLALVLFQLTLSCSTAQTEEKSGLNKESKVDEQQGIVLGNARMSEYISMLRGKKVAIVGNHSSIIENTHLVDSMMSLGIELTKVFSPEHGFRGKADAGEKVNSEIDPKTNLPIISLYGKNKKPTAKQLEDVEVILFDIQDVGVRFYTYISTLHYVMEASAEAGKKVIVLDRPNPNGHYIDGPILEASKKSFVGMHPVPIVHGMTIGEYAKMINGEAWLKGGIQCDLEVIPCKNYAHTLAYELEVAPSPNLPNMKSIYLYPSLCLFEGTVVSVGRGTEFPFQQIGHPGFKQYCYSFTPRPTAGAKSPKLNGEKCWGIDFSKKEVQELRNTDQLDLSFLIDFYQAYQATNPKFFTNFFDLLAGNSTLRQSIINGKTEEEIRKEWAAGLESFKQTRNKYLLYP